jgi:hypothetical protein
VERRRADRREFVGIIVIVVSVMSNLDDSRAWKRKFPDQKTDFARQVRESRERLVVRAMEKAAKSCLAHDEAIWVPEPPVRILRRAQPMTGGRRDRMAEEEARMSR